MRGFVSVVLCGFSVAACSGGGASISGDDAGPDAPTSVVEAGPDVVATDAGANVDARVNADGGDGGPRNPIGASCNPNGDLTDCPESFLGAKQILCQDQHSIPYDPKVDMYGRCSFGCYDSPTSTKDQDLCAGYGGNCVSYRPGHVPICVPVTP